MMKKAILILTATIALNATDRPLLNFWNNLDWSMMFDKSDFSIKLCNCGATGKSAAGFRWRIAEPIGAIETTNTPWNLVGLKMKMDKSVHRKQGNSRNDAENRRYSHFIAFAPMGLLNFLQDKVCLERITSPAFLYWSEIIPTQNNDILAMFLQLSKGIFGKALYNNPVVALSCAVDCAATTANMPINSLNMCSGCSGMTGNNTGYGRGRAKDPIVAHHVNSHVALDDLAFSGIMSKTSNATFAVNLARLSSSMCSPQYFPMSIKSQYYLQLMYPSVWDGTRIGELETLWANFKNKPTSEDDVSTWVWQIKDTCAGAARCKSSFGNTD